MNRTLDILDLVVLSAVNAHAKGAVVSVIEEEAAAMRGRKIAEGHAYTVLARLAKSGLLKKSWAPPRKIVGGRKRLLYKITPKGRSELEQAFGRMQTIGG